MARLLAALLLAVAAPSLAAPPPEVLAQAKAHFEAGKAAYEGREFEKAIREFEAAQALAPSPMLDHNIGLAHEQLGHREEAVAHYRKYLQARPDAPNRAEVEKRIATLAPPTETPAGGECPPGQTSNEDTAGHCCWPGQVWSKRRATCAGIPQCPPSLVAQGEYCVLRQAMQPMPLDSSPWPAYAPPPAGWGQPAGPPGTFPVTFNPKRQGAAYAVSVGKQKCTAPCTLYLKPGKHELSVGGDAEYATSITVGARPTTVRVEHMRLQKLIGGGIVTGVGLVLLGVGLALATDGGAASTGGCALAPCYRNPDELTGGVLMVVASLVLIPIGVPNMAMTDGNHARVLEPGAVAESSPPSGIRLVGAGIAPTPGGARAGLSFSF